MRRRLASFLSFLGTTQMLENPKRCVRSVSILCLTLNKPLLKFTASNRLACLSVYPSSYISNHINDEVLYRVNCLQLQEVVNLLLPLPAFIMGVDTVSTSMTCHWEKPLPYSTYTTRNQPTGHLDVDICPSDWTNVLLDNVLSRTI